MGRCYLGRRNNRRNWSEKDTFGLIKRINKNIHLVSEDDTDFPYKAVDVSSSYKKIRNYF